MKVGHIISGDLWGGSHAQVALQLEALPGLGVDANAFLFHDRECAERFRESGSSVTISSEQNGLLSLARDFDRWWRERELTTVVAHDYKETAVVALALLFRALLSPSLRRPAFIVTFHGLTEGYQGWPAVKMALYAALHRVIARFGANGIVCVSADLRKRLGFGGVARCVVVRNAVQIDPGVASDVERPWGGNGSDELPLEGWREGLSFVMVGRLVPIKRGDLAIDALSQLQAAGELTGERDYTLHFFGVGPEEAALKARARQANIAERVQFHGFRRDVQRWIAEAGGVIISSDSEGIPTVLLEAIALGTPVVATRVGGIPEVVALVPGAAVTLVAPGDAAGIAHGIRELSQGSEMSPTEIQGALELFSPERAVRECLSFYEGIKKGL